MTKFLRRGGVALLAALLCLNVTGCRTRSILSTKDEVRIGRDASRQVESVYRVDTVSADAVRVRRIGERVLAHTDKRDLPYSFKVIEERDINAVSLPGGPVYVFRGLLDMIGDDDDALACVIGHEIGHVNGRHAAERISSQLLTNIGISVFIGGRTAQDIASITSALMDLQYSREDEYDADKRGLSYAYKAGFDPRGMIRFFDELKELEKRGGGGGGPEFLRTHPVTAKRIERAKSIIERQEYVYGI